MPNLRYRRGANYERVLQKRLTEVGWSVTRSAASKGLFDLVAFPVEAVCQFAMLVQVKSLREKITAKQWLNRPSTQKELKGFGDFKSHAETVKVLAVFQPGEPTPNKKGTPPLRVTLFHVQDYVADDQSKRRKFQQIEIEGVSSK